MQCNIWYEKTERQIMTTDCIWNPLTTHTSINACTWSMSLLLLVAPTDRMFEDGSSSLQCPCRTLSSPSSPSTKPGGGRGVVHQGFSGIQGVVQGDCCFSECHNIFWFSYDRTSEYHPSVSNNEGSIVMLNEDIHRKYNALTWPQVYQVYCDDWKQPDPLCVDRRG